jgi:hypothetical protein
MLLRSLPGLDRADISKHHMLDAVGEQRLIQNPNVFTNQRYFNCQQRLIEHEGHRIQTIGPLSIIRIILPSV